MAEPRRVALGWTLGLWLGLAAPAAAQPAATVNVIPAPLSVAAVPGDAAPVRLANGAVILVPAGDAEALRTARYLSDLTRRTRGLNLPVWVGGHPSAVAITLARSPALQGEAYSLEVSSAGVRITAGADAGLFYGAVTLWQLITADGGRGPAALAPVRIDDAPRFAWRGLMIDSARHFQPPAEIEKLIDAMALHKLNVLHWHLTDDQGWRLQILKYPRLTEVGAWRKPQAGSPDGTARYGGFYTQAEVRQVVAYAAARHVTIVPEIEMPSHALSALLAYPRFGAGAAPARADQPKWGGFPYVYNVDDKTFGFLEDVLTEVMALFPGRYVHVGGDEAERERWNAAPAAQARMHELGISDPAALQAYFTHRTARFLEAHGRRLVGWDEILQGGELPADAVVSSWHGIDGGLAAAAKGHDAVLAPAPIFYFDNRQGLDPAEPPGRGWLVRLQDVYGFEPLPPTLPAATAAHILGVQGNVWTEHVRTSADLEAMAFPRAAAVAETAWSQPQRKDWAGFFRRLPAELARERALGLNADPAAVSVLIAPGPGLGVTLAGPAGLGEVRYTTDGSEPRATSMIYDQPITVAGPTALKATLFLDGVRVGPTLARDIDASGLSSRASQELKLCNDKLSLNLEGAPGAGRRTYLVNPADPCWIFTGVDLDRTRTVAVSFERLPFNFGLDPGHNTVMVHPSRRAAGELEVRQDSCTADPLVVASLPPGHPGSRTELRLKLPVVSGRHDLCFTFTGRGYDPVPSIDRVRLLSGPLPGRSK
ncbi:MAG: beta-N-acetylhexosaminidase [Phenylobacterium sp.]|nr:beta-N-acetylhexosaminidase [Phenylobacterium sp.]